MTRFPLRCETGAPRPLVRITAIQRLLLRHADVVQPETRLAVAAICQAIADSCIGSPSRRTDARDFMYGRRLDAWASLAGLNPVFVRDVATKTGYLPAQSAHTTTRSYARSTSNIPTQGIRHA